MTTSKTARTRVGAFQREGGRNFSKPFRTYQLPIFFKGNPVQLDMQSVQNDIAIRCLDGRRRIPTERYCFTGDVVGRSVPNDIYISNIVLFGGFRLYDLVFVYETRKQRFVLSTRSTIISPHQKPYDRINQN